MHEFSLYGIVARSVHDRVKQQLAGVARMLPQNVEEIRLVFRAKPPPSTGNLPSAGGSQGVMLQDLQKVKNMLNSSVYYVQLVGRLPSGFKQMRDGVKPGDATESNAESFKNTQKLQWQLEFKDTPDPGKQAVSSRLFSITQVENGNPALFLEELGYEYVSRYFVQGCKVYDQDTTLFLHQVLHLPQVSLASEAVKISSIPPTAELQPVDPGRQYILQALLLVVDGNHPDLKDRATKQLLAMKQTLRQAVDLTPGDRLAMDTKVPITRRI